jgi:hypothetical protein
VWKLGNSEKGLYPTNEAVKRLAEILQDAPVDKPLDLIWGPDLEVEVVEGDLDVIVTQLEDGNQHIEVVPEPEESPDDEDSSQSSP